jgi:hypothetical protein
MTALLAAPAARTAELPAAPGFRILPVLTPGMLAPYQGPLRSAVADLHRRAQGAVRVTPEAFYARLFAIPTEPRAALWLAVTASYRLLGFALASVGTDVFGVRWAVAEAVYLWPRRPDRRVFPALTATLEAWAQAHGAAALVFATARQRPRAWGRLGYRATTTVWEKELTS